MDIIEQKVKKEVFVLFGKGKFVEGEKILRQLSFNLNDSHSTEIKRLVLKNLSWVNNKLGNYEISKKYARLIKDILDRDEDYKRDNIIGTCDILNLYSELLGDELTVEEKIKINEMSYDCCHEHLEYLDKAIVAQYNIYILEKKFYDIKDIIELIHSYEGKTILDDEKGNKELQKKIKHIGKVIIEDIKNSCPIHIYDEIMDYLSTLSNTITAM